LCLRVRIGFPSPFPVPDGAPAGITVTNISSHALLIEWSPPDIPNGVITAYTIYINYNNGTSEAERVMDGSTLNYILDHLSPHQLVSVQMTANTSVGEGPRSTTENGITDPAGIKLQAMTYEFSVWINAFSLLNMHCLLLEEMCATVWSWND